MKTCICFIGLIFICSTLSAQYLGGDSDGFGKLTFTPVANQIYQGDISDGFAVEELDGGNHIYQGALSDGFSVEKVDGNNQIYQGSPNDGFAFQNIYQEYVWTGTIGSGWSVTGNWSTNQIPGLRHDVIIPSGAPHWPAVNAGTLSIGRNPTNAEFICNSIIVDTNAQMTTRINCFVTNYGKFVVKGSLFVKNTATDAFVNKMNSILGVQNGTITFSAN